MPQLGILEKYKRRIQRGNEVVVYTCPSIVRAHSNETTSYLRRHFPVVARYLQRQKRNVYGSVTKTKTHTVLEITRNHQALLHAWSQKAWLQLRSFPSSRGRCSEVIAQTRGNEVSNFCYELHSGELHVRPGGQPGSFICSSSRRKWCFDYKSSTWWRH